MSFETFVFAEGEETGSEGAANTGTAVSGTDSDAADVTAQGGLMPSVFIQLLPLVILFALLYFVMIRPQRKKEKETQAMLAAVKVGDKIVTIGGIAGKVTKIKDEYVYMESGSVGNPNEKSFLKIERSAIKTVEKKQQA